MIAIHTVKNIDTTIETFVENVEGISQAKIRAYRFVGTTRYIIEVALTNDIVDYITKCERLSKLTNEMFIMLSDIQDA